VPGPPGYDYGYYAGGPESWGPPRLAFVDGPVPAGYVVVEEPRKGPLIGGAITFGVSYGIGLLVAAGYNLENGTYYLAVPVLGPFLMLGLVDECEEDDWGYATYDSDCRSRDVRGILALDGLTQAVGAALLTYAVGWPRKSFVRQDLASLQLVPMISEERQGLMLTGRF
jgi:hypothetical protein